jgi:hypothetical protein
MTEDPIFALAQEAVEVLRSIQTEVFLTSELVERLDGKETWGAQLANRKNKRGRVIAVGAFFRQFQLASGRHTERGTRYDRLEVIAALGRHLPQSATPMEKKKMSGCQRPTQPMRNQMVSFPTCSGDEMSGAQPIDITQPTVHD